MKEPLVSCLTVTLDRLAALKTAIDCFCWQTYPNREMIIVSDGSQHYIDAIQRYITHLDRDDIRLISLGTRRTLGQLRNEALNAARGEIVCQWDDDDLYGPNRVARQVAHLEGAHLGASFLTDQLHYFVESRDLYWADWTIDQSVKKYSFIPGTVMMRRDPRFDYPEDGEFASAGEDSILLDALVENVEVGGLSGAGSEYVYTYHGTNTFDEAHHRNIFLNSCATRSFLGQHHAELMNALPMYRLAKPLTLWAREGEVYQIVN